MLTLIVSLLFLLLAAFSCNANLPQGHELVTPRRLDSVRTKRDNDAAEQRSFVFRAFGETIELHLEPDAEFLAGSLSVERISKGGRRSRLMSTDADQNNLKRCFYTGRTDLVRSKTASFNLCGGLMGAYRTDAGQFFVEPLTATSNDTDGDDVYNRPHVVYRRDNAETSFCDVTGQGALANDVARSVDALTRRRRRSQSMENFVEMLVVADESMATFYGRRLVEYLSTVMNVVSVLFSDPSLGNYVKVVIVRVLIVESNPKAGFVVSSSAPATLTSFCKWQQTENRPNGEEGHHDVAVLFTKTNICRSKGSSHCDTLGLAELGAMCNALRSCTIVEDTGVSSAFTTAHEVGHLLNMPHDGAAQDCLLAPDEYRIMAPSLSYLTSPWSWSRCSSQAITSFLSGGNGACLLNRPRVAQRNAKPVRLPGELFNLDAQCEMVFGKGVTRCKHMISSPCQLLWCSSTPTPACRTQHMPWADGTSCGNGKWCMRGKCEPKNFVSRLVNGGWSEWSSYGVCSRTCGGGVQFSERRCDDPTPSGGGAFCTGTRRRYRSCSTNECAVGSTPFRQVQCSQYNNKPHNFADLPQRVQWLPKYAAKGPDRCKLLCHSTTNNYKVYILSSKVVDGTPCSPDGFDVCVEGQCRPAGCDRVLGSDAKRDRCGVCGGRGGTCERMTGSVNRTTYGYNRVVTFPRGATHIVVRQTPLQARDDNYLAVMDESNRYVFNGGYFIRLGRNKYQGAGTSWYYNGSQNGLETLTTSSATDQAVTLMVLSVGRLRTADIRWSYNGPNRKEKTSSVPALSYAWEQGEWTNQCSRECQGNEKRIVVCRQNGGGGPIVDDGYCADKARLKPDVKPCNAACYFEWSLSWTTCSVTCGSGTQSSVVKCMKREGGKRATHVDASKCDLTEKPAAKRQSCQLVKSCPLPSVVKSNPVKINGEWRIGAWGRCSVTCGRGIQQRRVQCADFVQRRLVDDKQCDPRTRPQERQECLQRHCEDYKWKADSWTICSKRCGKGVQSRQLSCVNTHDVPVVSTRCFRLARPTTSRQCMGERCGSWMKTSCSECSASCGNGRRRCQVQCIDERRNVIDSVNCDASSKPKENEECLLKYCPAGKWAHGSWSKCSVTCGSGVRRQAVLCRGPDGKLLPDSECNGSERLAGKTEKCESRVSCYDWNAEDWSPCSKTCGRGNQHRKVRCLDSNKRIAQDAFCDPETKPESTQRCSAGPCPKWHTESFQDCSVTCGKGTKSRRVYCRDAQKRHVSDEYCRHRRRPKTHKSCRSSLCPAWRPSSWSACSRTCGQGEQTRSLYCKRGSKIVSSTLCSTPAPSARKTCQTRSCPQEVVTPDRHQWRMSGWSQCSAATCNAPGVQRRQVACFDFATGSRVDAGKCDGVRPSETSPCRGACGQWKVGDWDECSVPCGAGLQSRSVACVAGDGSGNALANERCVSKDRPGLSQSCNVEPCPPVSCRDVQRKQRKTTDGLYTLKIANRLISIYCYGMRTYVPEEYVPLSSHLQNFGSTYAYRLLNPSTCPSIVQEQKNRFIRPEKFQGSGHTIFSRVRLDLTRMELITNDYRFTSGEGRNEYGSAADCYSRTGSCPMGSFKIDLRETGLVLDAENEWTKEGGHVSEKITFSHGNAVATGRCGGYCGRCRPKNSRLKVAAA